MTPVKNKVVICGVAKDIADRIPYSLKIIEQIGTLFSDYKVLIYENDSSDNTANIIWDWSQTDKSRINFLAGHIDYTLLSDVIVNRGETGELFKPEAIARARNIIMDHVERPYFEDCEYVVWMDLDFKLEPNYDGIREVLQSDREWDGVFAYGMDREGNHWDWYPFRDGQVPLGSELIGQDWWYLPRKGWKLDQAGEWYPVYSGFGGCAIYRRESIKGCRYSGLVTEDLSRFYRTLISEMPHNKIIQRYAERSGDYYVNLDKVPSGNSPPIDYYKDPKLAFRIPNSPLAWRMSSFAYRYPSVCEHVPFHASMSVKGHGKFFINPRMVFTYGG